MDGLSGNMPFKKRDEVRGTPILGNLHIYHKPYNSATGIRQLNAIQRVPNPVPFPNFCVIIISYIVNYIFYLTI